MSTKASNTSSHRQERGARKDFQKEVDADFPYYCVEIFKHQDRSRFAAKAQSATQPRKTAFLARLHQYSTIASWLCLIDCTILPVLTFVAPLLGGAANLGYERLQFLHCVGGFTTIYFLLPIGCLSTVLNFSMSQHKRPWTALLGAVGLLMVALANSYSLPGVGHLEVFHFLHRGIWHRIVNVVGCCCLLASNHLSHKHVATKRASDGRKMDQETSCCILYDSLDKVVEFGGASSWRMRRRRYQYYGSGQPAQHDKSSMQLPLTM